MPLCKSSRGQFSSFLGRVENVGKGEPFIIGLFYGTSKPSNLRKYLETLIEVNELTTKGFSYMDLKFDVSVSSVICDASARAFVKNVKQYSVYHWCNKCWQSRMDDQKMNYPYEHVEAVLRTDRLID